jgi:hypothetical protein
MRNILKINPPRSVGCKELFTNGRSVWLSDEIISSILSTNRTSAGVEVKSLFKTSVDRGENIKKRAVPSHTPVKTAAALFQAITRRKPSFFNTRSLNPGRGKNSMSLFSSCPV